MAFAIAVAPLFVVYYLDPAQFSDEWLFSLFTGALLAMPFAYLALDGTHDWLPWTVAVVLTVVTYWALVTFLGPGLSAALVMLAAPVLITVATWATNRQS